MFGMNGFHVSASGAIQGHHGPLVPFLTMFSTAIYLKCVKMQHFVVMGEEIVCGL